MLLRPPPRLTNRSLVTQYLEVELWSWLREATTSFQKINFRDNFQAFEVVDLVIRPLQEVAIPNAFRTRYPGYVPTGRIITRQQGDANIIDGSTPWDQNLVYLYNPSQNEALINALFFL